MSVISLETLELVIVQQPEGLFNMHSNLQAATARLKVEDIQSLVDLYMSYCIPAIHTHLTVCTCLPLSENSSHNPTLKSQNVLNAQLWCPFTIWHFKKLKNV